MRFLYAVVRFVPDPIRAEFVNVGVIVQPHDTDELASKFVGDLRRARQLSGGDVSAVEAIRDALAAPGQGTIFDGASWNESLVPMAERLTRSIRLSDPLPMSAGSIGEALELAFSTHVSARSVQHRAFLDRRAARRKVRTAFTLAHLEPKRDFFEGVRLQAGRQTETLDFAVANGDVVQLTQSWSFEITNVADVEQQVKAWGFTMTALRADGGAVRTDNGTKTVSKDVELQVVCIPPRNERQRDALTSALGVFSRCGAAYVEADNAEDVAVRAASLLADRH